MSSRIVHRNWQGWQDEEGEERWLPYVTPKLLVLQGRAYYYYFIIVLINCFPDLEFIYICDWNPKAPLN